MACKLATSSQLVPTLGVSSLDSKPPLGGFLFFRTLNGLLGGDPQV
jgi:hypothetical protein